MKARPPSPLLTQAIEAHRHGRLDAAEALYARIIRETPSQATVAQRNLGIIYANSGRAPEAVALLAAAVRREPDNIVLLNDLARLHLAAQQPAEAIAALRRVLTLAPGNLPALINLGVTLTETGQHRAAVAALRQAVALDPRASEATFNLAIALTAAGERQEAIQSYRAALRIDPRLATAQFNLAALLEETQQGAAAIAAYEQTVALLPDFVAAWCNLGALLHQSGREEEALAALHRALHIDPNAAPAHLNLGLTLEELGRIDEAIQCYERAIAIDNSLAAHLNLGLALRHTGRLDESFAAFRRHAELKFGVPDGAPAKPPSPIKLKHDREQLAYLRAAAPEDFDRLFHLYPAERLETPAINPALDTATVAARWRDSQPQLVVVDELLTPRALAELRRFCWGSTVWRVEYRNGYLGAFPETGFAAPLLAQIGAELAARLPQVIGGHPLLQWWGFKYDSALTGINVHADVAAVNVNFWIAPDEANLDPAGGGLVVWDKPAPLDWDFETFNNDEGAIRTFLAESGATSVTVPHRCNRAVIFDSDLFHETDRISFKEGYENRRINITLLYGERDKAEG